MLQISSLMTSFYTLASLADGNCYAWGSNGFGQLGMPSDQDQGSRLSPRRVDELKHSFVVAVAAGDRHSVALTKVGEVYCWGDNRSGQLGRTTSSVAGSPIASPSQANSRSCHRPQRVDGLFGAQPCRRAMAVAAAEFSTLVLTMPPTVANGQSSVTSLPVNVVYGFGHGNHVPMRVTFPSASRNNHQQNNDTYTRSICINPTAIACAKYHNVAIAADGRVYTWGLHAESLGIEKYDGGNAKNWSTPRGKSSHSSATAPRLVSAMLPENGGGRAVAVSASESHTTIVTADGHLFTWGSSYGLNALGHKNIRWQPSPRKVKRVHRAVGVSAAKEHTALLIGTSFPSLPCLRPTSDDVLLPDTQVECYSSLSLQDMATMEIARNVDSTNVVPIANIAHRLNCRPLMGFCKEFLRMNLDGVLATGNIGDLETFLQNNSTFDGSFVRDDGSDGIFHPILYFLFNSKNWMHESRSVLNSCARSMPSKQAKKMKRYRRCVKPLVQKLSFDAEPMVEVTDRSTSNQSESEENNSSAPGVKEDVQPSMRKQPPEKHFPKPSGDATKYFCFTCGVCCPDEDSYTLHMSGRKHRNQLSHAKAAEEKKVAESMMAMKRMQLMGNTDSQTMVPVVPQVKRAVWGASQPSTPVFKQAPVSKSGSNSLLGIMGEESRKQKMTPVGIQVTPKIGKGQMKKTMISPNPGKIINFCVPTTTPIVSNSLPLSAFIGTTAAQKQNGVSAVGASWADKPVAPRIVAPRPKATNARSFAEIQREEEDIRNKEDHTSRLGVLGGSKWYVSQRERAASIGDIQQQQTKDEEWLRLVEEQKAIEAEIARANSAKKQRKRLTKKKPSKEAGKSKTASRPDAR